MDVRDKLTLASTLSNPITPSPFRNFAGGPTVSPA
ncbi:hypothetical protein PF003_g26609 [Phytophthora fragariae]|nr:hypothetical protein PF003_g26609 [Phytophthora fragariae]